MLVEANANDGLLEEEECYEKVSNALIFLPFTSYMHLTDV